jgi:hypothetical protein
MVAYAMFMNHILRVTQLGAGYELSLEGPIGRRVHPRRFLTAQDAKIEAHPFVHSLLGCPCICAGGQIEWDTSGKLDDNSPAYRPLTSTT